MDLEVNFAHSFEIPSSNPLSASKILGLQWAHMSQVLCWICLLTWMPGTFCIVRNSLPVVWAKNSPDRKAPGCQNENSSPKDGANMGQWKFQLREKSVQVQVLQPKQILRWFHPSLEIPKKLPHQRTNYCSHWLIVVSGKRSSTKTCLLFQDLFNSK